MAADLNFYGQPIADLATWDGEHGPGFVPSAAGLPPVCACGWTRHFNGRWYELADHLADMGVG